LRDLAKRSPLEQTRGVHPIARLVTL
jgi:hypothetical protein